MFGRLYTWGDCTENSLGHRICADLQEPTLVQALVEKNLRAIDVACGDKFTVFVVSKKQDTRIKSEEFEQFMGRNKK